MSQVRQAHAAGEIDTAKDLKKLLPGALFSGQFKRRSAKALKQHSGIICIDCDDLEEDAAAQVDMLRFDPHIIAAFVSPRGNGIKVLIAVPPDAEQIANFQAAKTYLKTMYNLVADESGKDVSRLCFLSYDPNLHYAPDAVELPPDVAAEMPVLGSGESKKKATGGENERLGDRYNSAPDIRDRSVGILTGMGWKIGRGNSDKTYCTRPGKERGISGTLWRNGAFYCFTDNASPLLPSEGYSPFALLTAAKFSGDFKAAALSLVEEFGEDLPEASGTEFYGKERIMPDEKAAELLTEAAGKLPEWTPADRIPKDLSKRIMQKYPVLIDGLLHRGTKMVLGGGSKSYKTWTLLNLAASVASGQPWFGHECVLTKKDVIYLNFEVPHEFFLERVKCVCAAMEIEPPPLLKIWSLRGVCNDLRVVLEAIKARIEDESLALICIDPIYKALGDRDENSAGDMGLLMNEVEALVERTGAAAAFGAHYSKGNQSEKDPLDRVSGSGVFARDPDTILGLTAHEEEDCFTVDVALRNLPRVEPFVVKWEFPLFKKQDELDPGQLKKVGQKVSKKEALAILEGRAEGLTKGEWKDELVEIFGLSRQYSYRIIKRLEAEKRVNFATGRYFAKI